MKLLQDRVALLQESAETKTKGGIIIPDQAKEKPLIGTVKFVGPGTKDEPLEVKVGDRVLFGKYAGTEVDWEGETLVLMREADIIGIINTPE